MHFSFPIVGKVLNGLGYPTNEDKEVNEVNVRAYWNEWSIDQIVIRGNVYCLGGEGGATPTYNCWSYSLGYTDIWIQNPLPIYSDDYVTLTSPVQANDVIPIGGHVISIFRVSNNESSVAVVGTDEKNRFSGIYLFEYDGAKGGFNNPAYINYLRPR